MELVTFMLQHRHQHAALCHANFVFFLLVVDELQLYRNMVDNVLYITSVEATFTLICY